MKYLVTILFLSSIFISCNTEAVFKDRGTIIGLDLRTCACCGGYFIDINGESKRFYFLPDTSSLKAEDIIFPFEVKLKWEISNDTCLGDEITVHDIEAQ
ncbi:MAG: hypothetical protein MRZ79_19635 [Bacteroidia bacterium]|nr:hypothetical protein [Bacteroidia bacterium]